MKPKLRITRTFSLGLVALVALLALPLACGGETRGASDSGATVDGGPPGSRCRDLTTQPSDFVCQTDGDCTEATAGEICAGDCSCGGTAVNLNAGARLSSELAAVEQELKLGECSCPFFGTPRCIAGQCTLCGAASPASCGASEAGTTTTANPPDASTDDSNDDSADDSTDAGDGVQANCLCIDPGFSCANVPCSSDSNCAAGEHCGVGLGSPGDVCSVSCLDGASCPSGTQCRTFVP